MSHIPSIVDHARVAVMTFPSPPSLPLSRPWAGWVRGYHCSRSSWFRDHQSPHLLPKFPLSHLDIWQKIWLWAFLPSILHHFLKLVKLQAFSPSCLLVCTALCECECIWVSFFFFFFLGFFFFFFFLLLFFFFFYFIECYFFLILLLLTVIIIDCFYYWL